MISCTEFIPAYSELFKFIDRKSGRQAVYDYWDFLFQPEKSPLNDYLEKYGLRGCWEYWKVIFTEEACDGTVLFNEQEGWYASCMHHCPSKGRFNKLGYLKPFDEYCKHCDGYDWSLKKYGLVHVMDYRGEEKACCREIIYDPKVYKGDGQKLIDEMYACEMNGCGVRDGKCILNHPGTQILCTSPKTLKYLHREFHVSMDRGADYARTTYGMDGLREYLTQFTAAFHVPLIADIKNRGLAAVEDYLNWLYRTEEASDALAMIATPDELDVRILYCPAVRYMKGRGYTPSESYKYCTSMVYEALAELTGIGFEMGDYEEETGAATYRFFKK